MVSEKNSGQDGVAVMISRTAGCQPRGRAAQRLGRGRLDNCRAWLKVVEDFGEQELQAFVLGALAP